MAEQSANRPLTSKAVTYKSLGGYEVIEFVKRTVRAPAAGEVRIEVKAAAVNPTDLMFRDPGFANLTSNIVPGMDAAGVIESVGAGVSRLHPGQKVIAAVNPVRPEGGAQAQHIVVPAASVVPMPEGVSLAQASILPMTGLTALNALEIASSPRPAASSSASAPLGNSRRISQMHSARSWTPWRNRVRARSRYPRRSRVPARHLLTWRRRSPLFPAVSRSRSRTEPEGQHHRSQPGFVPSSAQRPRQKRPEDERGPATVLWDRASAAVDVRLARGTSGTK
jgi:hypothetical protein